MLVAAAGAAPGEVGEEGEVAAEGEFADGEDVPGVFEDIGDEEVDSLWPVADFGGAAAEVAGGDVIGAVEIASAGLDLRAKLMARGASFGKAGTWQVFWLATARARTAITFNSLIGEVC